MSTNRLRLVDGTAEHNEQVRERIDVVVHTITADLLTLDEALRQAYMAGWNDRREAFEAIVRCAHCDKILDETVPARQRCTSGGRHVPRRLDGQG